VNARGATRRIEPQRRNAGRSAAAATQRSVLNVKEIAALAIGVTGAPAIQTHQSGRPPEIRGGRLSPRRRQ
jgi:hypothetical protein